MPRFPLVLQALSQSLWLVTSTAGLFWETSAAENGCNLHYLELCIEFLVFTNENPQRHKSVRRTKSSSLTPIFFLNRFLDLFVLSVSVSPIVSSHFSKRSLFSVLRLPAWLNLDTVDWRSKPFCVLPLWYHFFWWWDYSHTVAQVWSYVGTSSTSFHMICETCLYFSYSHRGDHDSPLKLLRSINSEVQSCCSSKQLAQCPVAPFSELCFLF